MSSSFEGFTTTDSVCSIHGYNILYARKDEGQMEAGGTTPPILMSLFPKTHKSQNGNTGRCMVIQIVTER